MSKNSSSKCQVIVTILVNLTNISYGLAAGWTSSSFLILESAASPILTGPLTTAELSWINSILPIGAIFGTILYTIFSKKTSRKLLLITLAVLQITSWIVIIYATETWHFYVARILAGMSCGGSFVIVPIFVFEIARERLHSRLKSILMLAANLGYLLAFIAGYVNDYATLPLLFLIVPVVYLASQFFIMETPIQLIREEKLLEAENSLRFYWNPRTDREIQEFHNHLKYLKGSVEREQTEQSTVEQLKELCECGTISLRQPIIICLALVILQEMSGCYTMLSYTATIFEDSGSIISANWSAIIVGTVQLVGAFLSIILVDRIRRKPLLIWSSIGTGFSLTCLGCYALAFRYNFNVAPFSWIPIVSFSMVLFSAAIGILPLPLVVSDEIMAQKLNNIGTCICLCTDWTISFLLVKFFGSITDEYGIHVWLFLFAISCFVGAIYVSKYMPESAGTTPDEYQPILQTAIA